MLPFRMRSAATALAFVLTLALSAGPLRAQSSKGILTGSAKDSTGASVPGATVTLRGEQTGETRTATTKSDGSYRFDALSPEPYTITVQQSGFSTFKAEHVNVAPSLVTSYDVPLTVGSRSDTVTVEADQIQLDTENGQLAGTIAGTELRTLPIFSLNPFELSSTIPGVQTVNGTNQFSNGVNLQVHGARPRSNNFLLDSQEINDVGIGGQAFQPQIPDMYQDLTAITSSASAEYARAGGGVFNLITRSGSNQWHGSVYDRYTGSGLNALKHAQRGTVLSATNKKARFDTHTLGFTGGGALIKDKLFAFGGASFFRFYGQTQIKPILVPDPVGVATLNSLTSATAVAQVALLKTYLMNYSYQQNYTRLTNLGTSSINIGTTQAGCATSPCTVEAAYYQRPVGASLNPGTQWGYRIDFKPSSRDNFYVRYLHDRSSLTPDFFANAAGGALGLDTFQGGPSELGAGSWTHIFTSSVLNEFRASETRISFLFAPTTATLANPVYALPTINISSFPSLGPGQNFPQGRAEDLYQVQDTFSLTKGRQTIRAGFDIGRQLEKDTVSLNVKGTATFARGSTGVTSLGNFLLNQLGPSGAITRTIGPTRVDPHGWRSGFWAQDDVKFSPEFTINLGVRYDYTTDPENSLQYPAIDPGNPYLPLTTVIPVRNDLKNISPRLGFAYTPSYGGMFGSGKTVFRGGFGIFYDSYFSNFVVNAAQSAPNVIAGTLTQTTGTGITNAISNLNTFVPTLGTTASVTSVVNNLRNPQTYQYNLGIEHQIKGAVLAVRYVGDRGEHLFANQQYNFFNGAGRRLNPARGAINARGNFADSNYNGLETEANIRIGTTIFVRANYTFSKDLDDGSEIFTTGDNTTSYSANLAPGGRRQDYGPSAFDHRHFASFTYVWSPKGFHSSNGLTDVLLSVATRHWTISGVEQFQSGPYGSFNGSGLDTNGDGSSANDRPVLGNPKAPFQTVAIDGYWIGGNTGTYYDLLANNATGALTKVDPNTQHFIVPVNFDNSFLSREIGRNSFRNPGSTLNNIALQKGFSLPRFERGQFLLRAEVENIGNHNDRGDYLDTDVLDWGQPTSFETQSLARLETGRSVILWAKFIF